MTSIAASIFVTFRFRTQQQFYKIQSKVHYNNHYRHLYSRTTILYLVFFFEFAVLWIFPYPNLSTNVYIYENAEKFKENKSLHYLVCYKASELVLVLMSLRFYFIVKCILNNSRYRDIFSSYYCNKYNTRAGFRFAAKSLFAGHHWLLIFCLVAPSVLFLAESFRIFERPFSDVSHKNFESYANSM